MTTMAEEIERLARAFDAADAGRRAGWAEYAALHARIEWFVDRVMSEPSTGLIREWLRGEGIAGEDVRAFFGLKPVRQR